MKNLFHFVWATIVPVILVSCQQGKEMAGTDDAVHFAISAESPETRTFITNNGNGTYTPSWSAGDKLGVYFTTVSGSATTFVNGNAGHVGLFEPVQKIKGVSGAQTLYAFYPLDAFQATATGKRISLNVKEAQTPGSVTTFDKDADILVAAPYSGNLTDGSTIGLTFTRPLSVVKITPTSPSMLADEYVRSIRLEYNGSGGDAPLTGRVELNLETGALGSWPVKTYRVSASYEDGVFPVDGVRAAYLLVNPVSIPVGKKVTFTVTTNKHVASREFTLSGKALTFPAGNIATIGLSITNDWTIEGFAVYNGSEIITGGTLGADFTNLYGEWMNKVDNNPPPPDPNRSYKSVIILGLDGAGTFSRNTSTPNIDRIFPANLFTLSAESVYPTISAQNWGAALHGVLPVFHRLTNDVIESYTPYPVDSPYPSVFRVIREARPDAELASICNWYAVNSGIIENNLNMLKQTSSSDAEITTMVINYLQNSDPTLLYVHLNDVDDAGHSYGFGSSEHLAAITRSDGRIGQIYDVLRAKANWEDTLLILITDHGGTPGGGHGGWTDAERYIFFGVTGGRALDTDTPFGAADTRDVAAIVTYALGIDMPDTWSARVPSGIFKGVAATERKATPFTASPYRSHQTQATPAMSTLQSALSGHTVKAYIPFDGTVSNELGSVGTTTYGSMSFSDAYFGKGATLNNGYIKLSNISFGTGSFSVAFWIKTAGASRGSDPPLLCNKNWGSGMNRGIALALLGWGIQFNAGSRASGSASSPRMDLYTPYLPDYDQGWFHITLVVDRTNNRVRFYQDFAFDSEVPIPSSMQSTSFDSEYQLYIGTDGRSQSSRVPAQIDEFIITSDVLTDADIARLKAHYD